MVPRTSVRSKNSSKKRILKKRGETLKRLSKVMNEGINPGPELKASLGTDLVDLSGKKKIGDGCA